MRKMLVRMLAVGAVGALLFSAAPAQAHHRKSVNALKARVASLEAKVAALRSKTQHISPDGTMFGGFTVAFQALILDSTLCPTADPDDDARFYYQSEADLWYLDCSSFYAPRQSVDAASGNKRRLVPMSGEALASLESELAKRI